MLTRKLLTEPLQFVKGVGPDRAGLLLKLGLRSVADILFCFPRRYEDFTQQTDLGELRIGELASVIGEVVDVDQKENTERNRHVLYVLIRQGELYLRGIWFNQEYLVSKFRIGQIVQLSGKVQVRGLRLEMVHPKPSWLDEDSFSSHRRLLPVYGLTEGLKQSQMRSIAARVVEQYGPLVEESLPEELRTEAGVCGIHQAIQQIHLPEDHEQVETARRRLVFQELLVLQLALAIRRHRVKSRATAHRMELTAKIRSRIMSRLPFELTESQKAAFEEIAADMGRVVPMNRLLHGEVGSGKTAVAVCAILLSLAHQRQAVFMAPTEILAQQHFRTISRLLAGARARTALLTGGISQKQRSETLAATAQGEIDLLIGTTAVISERVQFRELGLVVIDEQHKFGVRQRATLKQSGFDPHYLVLTATPIPRTVTMTMFGDLDVSTLVRGSRPVPKIYTYLGSEDNREKWWGFFCNKLVEGRQGFVIAPRVDSDDESDVRSAERLYESLANGPLEAFRAAVVHGRQSSEQRLAVMRDFEQGKCQVLIATGVVEVGIDIPNATVMTIESAERFGLSQLHQLRGRVGRGLHPGYVCAFVTSSHPNDVERLKAFERSSDGFELAQIDLKLRGPGDLLGVRQTGMPAFLIADLARDEELLHWAQKFAQTLADQDPDLARPELNRLRQLVIERYGKALELSDVG
jgi:ATP-dependent DNA helicase RecG